MPRPTRSSPTPTSTRSASRRPATTTTGSTKPSGSSATWACRSTITTGSRRTRSLADQLKGKLLLIHGEMDENVHPASTLVVVDALIKANKDFDLLILPNLPHCLRRRSLLRPQALGLLRPASARRRAAGRLPDRPAAVSARAGVANRWLGESGAAVAAADQPGEVGLQGHDGRAARPLGDSLLNRCAGVASGRTAAGASSPSRAMLGPADLLLRRLRRRRLEDDRRRASPGATSPTASSRPRRSARSPSPVRPERDLRRHGRDVDPRQRLARRRRLQVDRRRRDLAQRRADATPATSARSDPPARTPTSSTSPRSATPWGRTRSAASSARSDGGETWEQVLYKSDRAGAHDLSMDPNNPRILYAAIWQAQRYPHALDSRRRGVRPLALDRRRRHLGRDHPQARAAEGRAGQDRRRRLAGASRAASGRWSRPRTARSSAPTTAARPGSG